jgi:hypothetical protein
VTPFLLFAAVVLIPLALQQMADRGLPAQPFPCHRCSSQFSRCDALRLHLSAEHPDTYDIDRDPHVEVTR